MSDGGGFSGQLLYRLCQLFSSVTMCLCISMIGYGVYKTPMKTPQVVGGGLGSVLVVCVVCTCCMASGAEWIAEQVEDKLLD